MAEDGELLERLQAGDEAAFGELIGRYHTRLVRFARSYVADAHSAEDVAQETWLAVIRGVERFEGRSSLRTWLYRVCANRARTRGVADHRSVAVGSSGASVNPDRFDRGGAWAAPLDPWGDIDDRLFAEAVAPVVLEAIEGLPDGQRQVVTLRDVEGLTSKETCEVLSISETHQRVLLHRARARLRSAIEARQGDC
ncbi:MAG: RNA polymerase sigma factor [Acidimicrobiaceae bacterium]|nr:RNA polymerase sigma factor [Acidimicrobiaceae bacterium]